MVRGLKDEISRVQPRTDIGLLFFPHLYTKFTIQLQNLDSPALKIKEISNN